jgi:hypothetical protein
VKPSVTTTSTSPEDVASLDVADVFEVGVAVRIGPRQQLVRVARQRCPLVVLRTVRQQADARALLAVQQARVHRPEHRELREHGRLRIDVGAHVEQRALARFGREGRDDGRPLDAGQAPEHEQPARHHGARVPRGHDRVGLTGLDQIEADAHRRLLLLLHRHRR